MFETIILPLLTLLLGGGIASAITLKATRRKADADAAQAEIQVRTEEFHLLKEQIELNQQQNLDLTQLNLKLTEHIKDKTQKYAEQTEVLRKTQAKLLKSEEDKIQLVTANGDLKVELAKKKCEDELCPFRQPPNANTPPRPNMTNEEYHMAVEKIIKSRQKKAKENCTKQTNNKDLNNKDNNK